MKANALTRGPGERLSHGQDLPRRTFLGLLAALVGFRPKADAFCGVDLASRPDVTVVWNTLPLLPADVALMESRRLNVEAVARAFNVPVELLAVPSALHGSRGVYEIGT